MREYLDERAAQGRGGDQSPGALAQLGIGVGEANDFTASRHAEGFQPLAADVAKSEEAEAGPPKGTGVHEAARRVSTPSSLRSSSAGRWLTTATHVSAPLTMIQLSDAGATAMRR